MPVLSVSLAAASIPATAQHTDDRPRRVVSFNRADLMTESGRARIDRHIALAAEDVCGWSRGRIAPIGRPFRDCRNQAVADGRRQLAERVASATASRQLAKVSAGPAAR